MNKPSAQSPKFMGIIYNVSQNPLTNTFNYGTILSIGGEENEQR